MTIASKALDIYESLTGFEKRDGQREMIRFMAECIDDGCNGALEAPTGTGKSLAVLVVAYAAWKELVTDPSYPQTRTCFNPRWRRRTSSCLKDPYPKGRIS